MSDAAALLSHLDRAFPADALPARLGVAVSGGSDSLGLLHLLLDWGRVPLVAVTVDHGLREESAGEAAQVAETCRGLGVRHATLEWTGWDGTGNLQDQARRARYRLLSDWAASEELAHIALGHTLDDQAETFLLGLARGAGLDGLTGMRPVFRRGGTRFHRPLLEVRHGLLRSYLTGRGVNWIDDPTNVNTHFDRVKARRALEALAPLGIDAGGLGQTIANLSDTRSGIETFLQGWARHHVTEDRGDLLIDTAGFDDLPPDFARRVLNAGLRWISGADYPPRAGAVMTVIHGAREGRSTLHGCLISFGSPGIRLAREPQAAARAGACATDAVWDGRWRLCGPHAPDLEIRALGAPGLNACADWRTTLMPRDSLLSSPAVWRDGTLIAAPITGFSAGWTALLAPGRDEFAESLISR
ncbi:MAG: tRNA lysidine(34) synthetase TilS [Rhodobacter sp.]|nr:tRNA lysidine(34) synthetase TilS [Rhodobacter sp.]